MRRRVQRDDAEFLHHVVDILVIQVRPVIPLQEERGPVPKDKASKVLDDVGPGREIPGSRIQDVARGQILDLVKVACRLAMRSRIVHAHDEPGNKPSNLLHLLGLLGSLLLSRLRHQGRQIAAGNLVPQEQVELTATR